MHFKRRYAGAVFSHDLALAPADIFMIGLEQLAPAGMPVVDHQFTGAALQQGAFFSSGLSSRITGHFLKRPVDRQDNAFIADNEQSLVHGIDNPAPVPVGSNFSHG